MSYLTQFFSGGGVTRKRQQVFTSSGTFTPSARLLALGGYVEVLCVGGGGGAYADSGYYYGGGGGAVVRRIVQVTGNVSVTVGAGGVNGGDGGDTSFGSLVVAAGGKGISGGFASGNGHAAATLGIPSRSESYTAGGGAGGPAVLMYTGESSPSALLGIGPIPGPGIDGYGCGGRYNVNPAPNSGSGGGGDGASGICIVEWLE